MVSCYPYVLTIDALTHKPYHLHRRDNKQWTNVMDSRSFYKYIKMRMYRVVQSELNEMSGSE